MQVRQAATGEHGQWDSVLLSSPQGSFLQSWAWGEVQLRLGVNIWRLIVEDNEEWKGLALLLKRPQPLGRSWLYVPRGPHFAPQSVAGRGGPAGWDELEKKLVELGEEEDAIFVRLDPTIQAPLPQPWRKSEREVQPRDTLVLDLTKSEEELLADMHQKTRYNVRLAQKKGVNVRFSTDVADVKHFLQLSKDVSERIKFSFHPDEYYRAIMEVLGDSPTSPGLRGAARAELALAELQGEVLAAHLIVSFGNTVTYMHGASSSKSREVMAPHLLQWETIERAKAAGRVQYDFFGVAPEGAPPTHPWAGITRFKLGFGGQRVAYIGAYDMVLSEGLYQLFTMARRFRALLR